MNIKTVSITALLVSLAGCTSNGNGDGFTGVRTVFDNPYQPRGHGGVYTGAEFGWYEGFFYPGKGSVVFDSEGKRRKMTSRQRKYWDRQRDLAAQFGAIPDISAQGTDSQAPKLALPVENTGTSYGHASRPSPTTVPQVPTQSGQSTHPF